METYFVDENKYTSGGFKSYYVVWKRIYNFVIIQFRIYCLNRTMQYGNGGLTKEKNNQKIV